jgi:hypothetical protein
MAARYDGRLTAFADDPKHLIESWVETEDPQAPHGCRGEHNA